MQSVFGSAVVATTLMLVGGCGSKDNGGGAAGGGDPRLEGTYTLVETEMGGVRSKETEQKGTFAFSGDKMISPNGKKEEAATIKCDPSKTPAEITISKTEVSGKINTFYGIYKLEDDTLTLCLMKSDNPANRPKEFKTSKESIVMIEVFKKTQ
ncbi:MAG TPA: TIGR03067 domain-containing protein [Gemmata sp.]|nr:TIGR03067 domain-containing protein [Gemmata sp.]